MIPDNTKAIILDPDAVAPRVTPAVLEYAHARHFHIDAARVKHARDTARVERAVPGVRDDCCAGELLTTIDDGRTLAVHWCLEDYGLRRQSRTQQRPRELFEAEERAALLPLPAAPYDIPEWAEPKVGRDQPASVAKALYSRAGRVIVHAPSCGRSRSREQGGDRSDLGDHQQTSGSATAGPALVALRVDPAAALRCE